MTSATDMSGASRAPLTRHRRRVRVATTGFAACIGGAWVVATPDDPVGTSAFVAVTAAGIVLGALADRALRSADLLDDTLRATAEEARVTRDRLEAANATLQSRNAEVVATHVAVCHMLDLADDRTGGRLRMIVEDTSEELADMLFARIGNRGTTDDG